MASYTTGACNTNGSCYISCSSSKYEHVRDSPYMRRLVQATCVPVHASACTSDLRPLVHAAAPRAHRGCPRAQANPCRGSTASDMPRLPALAAAPRARSGSPPLFPSPATARPRVTCHVHGMYMACTWHVHGMSANCKSALSTSAIAANCKSALKTSANEGRR